MFERSADRVQEDRQDDVTARALTEVSDPLARLCAEDPTIRARVGVACDTAAGVVAAPPTPAPLTPAPDGAKGDPGRGIKGTLIRADGHLVVTYDDGEETDVGLVVGQDGTGIASSTITAGRLTLTYSDGRIMDLGKIVGDPGRGITDTSIVDGRLIVSYDDGTTEDAGELPAGPAGVNSPAARLEINQPDGTRMVCPRTGGADDAPVYTCEETSE